MADLTIHRTESHDWLSNAYLVVNPETRQGVLIDGNGVSAPLLGRIEQDGIDVTAILLTHHHVDHVDISAYREFGAPVLAHPATAELAGLTVDQPMGDNEVLSTAGMQIMALHTPGHALDHLAYVIDASHCFTADVLFRGTVGGTRGPGGSNLGELRSSLERLLALPPETVVHPGHREPTTVAEENAENPFICAFRGELPRLDEACTVRDEPAELLFWGPDYDGTNKAWVRLGDGVEHVVGGSQVKRG